MPHKFTEAIFRAKLPLVEKMVLWVLSEHANANGVAWPGQSRLAALAGCDYSTVVHALKRLQDRGHIAHTGWHASPNGPTKEFTLNLKAIVLWAKNPVWVRRLVWVESVLWVEYLRNPSVLSFLSETLPSHRQGRETRLVRWSALMILL